MLETQLNSWSKTKKETAEKSRFVILKHLKESESGLTLFELVKLLGWPVNRISGRITELTKENKIYDSGMRRTNPDSGRPGAVWKAKT